MARVEWTRLSGDEVEEIVAIFLSRENSRATRIRPSQGDGGIDVIVPDDGSDSYSVYQIKKFAQNLESNEKRQIASSYGRLTAYVSEQGISVSAWHLVMPLDPTNENRSWFSGVTQGAAFDVNWHGLIFCDGMAAKYPDVTDYYVRDGKDRLMQAVTELAQVMASDDVSAGPAGAIGKIEALHSQMNRWDPHYKYDLMVTDVVPDPAALKMPGVVCVHQTASGERCVSVIIKARFEDAVNVRPIPMTLRFNVDPGSASADAVQEHLDFGADLELEDGQVEFSIDLPGGLGVEGAKSGVRIVSLATGGSGGEDVLLEIVSPDGQVLASTVLVVKSRVAGQTGKGGMLFGSEANGVFEASWRLDFSSVQTRLTITTASDFSGMRLEELLNGVSFLSKFHNPNRFRVSNPYSGVTADSDEIVPDPVPVTVALVQVVRSLLEIQKAAKMQIRFPGLQDLTPGNVNEWNRAAALLRGESVSIAWDSIRIPLDRSERERFLAQLPAAVTFHNALTVNIGGRTLNLGTQQFHCAGVTILLDSDGEPVGDGESVCIAPLNARQAVITLLDESRQADL
ncbi:hypothetical protein [Streptomyces parvus]|uniref:hypothetical protein n=1 Tax=Streptomyces parvus TaxID=66428 RepID=UPI00344BEB0B